MDVIKWGFFLKSLKQLFIILLISCFTLLVNSSVSAYSCNSNKSSCWDFNFWEYENSNWFKWVVVDNNLNFYWLSFDYYIWENRFLSIWWQEESPGFTGYYMTARNTNLNYNFDTTSRCYYYWICGSRPPEWSDPWDYCTMSTNFSQLSSLIRDHNRYLFNCRHFWDNYLGCSVCSYNSEWWDYICLDSYNWNSQISHDFASRDYIIARATLNPYSSNVYRWTTFKPSTWSRLDWRLVTQTWYSNSQMVKAYECVWLQPSLCYWGFPINNIFNPSESFEDFSWYIAGQGATIFDLYNLYSSSFSSMDQFLNTVLTRYRNWQINQFKTEPKALLMVGSQLNTAWFKVSYVSTYCDLLLNKNNNSSYTWQSVDDLRAQSCYRSQKVQDWLKSFEWEDVIFQTTPDYFWSWEDVNFDADTFFSTIMNEITTKLDQPYDWLSVWLIPWYIVIFMLAFIFIRLLSH